MGNWVEWMYRNAIQKYYTEILYTEILYRNTIKIKIKEVDNWVWKVWWRKGNSEGFPGFWLGWRDNVIHWNRKHREVRSRWVSRQWVQY